MFPTADVKNSPFILGAASYLFLFNDRVTRNGYLVSRQTPRTDGDRGFSSSGTGGRPGWFKVWSHGVRLVRVNPGTNSTHL